MYASALLPGRKWRFQGELSLCVRNEPVQIVTNVCQRRPERNLTCFVTVTQVKELSALTGVRTTTECGRQVLESALMQVQMAAKITSSVIGGTGASMAHCRPASSMRGFDTRRRRGGRAEIGGGEPNQGRNQRGVSIGRERERVLRKGYSSQ